jgi:hypothetical protein
LEAGVAEFVDLVARLTAAVAHTPPEAALSARLCEAYRGLAGATSAALTVRYAQPDRVTLTATDELSNRLEDLQELVGEGPGYAAAGSGHIEQCHLGGSGHKGKWTMFEEAALDIVGVAVIHAVPMRPVGEVFGVATLYQTGDDRAELALAPDELQLLANAVGAALVRDRSALELEDTGPWSSRAHIHQATGMLIAQLRIGADDALALLRAHAYAHQTTLSDIAAAVVQRRINFPIS